MTALLILIDGTEPVPARPQCNTCRCELHPGERETGVCAECRTRILRRLRGWRVVQRAERPGGAA